ncbi:hypothetical protein VTO73DRAFT_7080 [Trametes versicolor]
MSTANATNPPVLIVGAGPAGLVAALALVQNGIPARIVEKLPAFHTASRAGGVHSRSLEVYHFLGLMDDIRRVIRPLMFMRAYKLPEGTEVTRTWKILETVEPTPDRPITTALGSVIGQFVLEGIFRDNLAKYGAQVELATELVSFEQDADGVTATLKHAAGTDQESIETFRAAYVIGADGGKGITRRQMGATFEGVTKDGDGQVWADVTVENLSTEFWHLWSEPERFTVSMRPTYYDEGRFNVGIVGTNWDPVDLMDQTKFVKFIHDNTGHPELKISNFTSMIYWKPKMRMVNKFSSGRAFLVGDAAHVHSPTGAQGLNTSIQDSFNLAWKIALVYKGLAKPELLSSFEAERLPVVTLMLATTSGLYNCLVVNKDSAPPKDPKDKSGFLMWRNNALFMMEINYRWSPIVLDARGNGDDVDALKAKAYEGYPGEDVHAGDRAPGAPALIDAEGKATWLHDIYKPTLHTILIFSPETDEAASQVDAVSETVQSLPKGTYQIVILARHQVPKARSGALGYHDSKGHAFGAYHVEEGKLTVVVVRPDAYVGAFIYDAQGLQAYFSRIFGSA